jgi:hypothetical protein
MKDESYYFDYGTAGIRRRGGPVTASVNPYLIKTGSVGKALHRLLRKKHVYPSPEYIHALVHAKAYLGPGLFFSSYRTADAWGHRAALLTWDHSQINYGVPMIDGKTYISIGKRHEMFPGNEHWADQRSKEQFTSLMSDILSDNNLLNQVVEHQTAAYVKYFSHPKVFVEELYPAMLPSPVI